MVEDVGNNQPYPDNEAHEGDGVDADDAAEAGFPELAHIGHQADREEAEAEENAAQQIGLTGAGFGSRHNIRLSPASDEDDDEACDKTDDEFREASPDFPFRNLAAALDRCRTGIIEMVNGPDNGQNEGPDADEDIDEDLRRRRRHEDPAFLIIDAELLQGTAADERIRDCPGSDRPAVTLDDQAEPRAGDHRFTGQEIGRRKRQDEQFHSDKDDDDRRQNRRDDLARLDGTARRDGRSDTADRNTRGHGSRPFRRELEELAGYEINDRPVNQIRFDDSAHTAQDDRPGQAEGADCLDADIHTQDDDARLDVPFRFRCIREETRHLREEIADHQPGQKGDDKDQFTETEGPADIEGGALIRRRCQVCIIADKIG